jgi:transcription-repair coupling factor (superfamily II helicase)
VRAVDELQLLPVDLRAQPAWEPAPRAPTEASERKSLLEYLPPDAVVVHLAGGGTRGELDRTWSEVRRLHAAEAQRGNRPEAPETLFLPAEEAARRLEGFAQLFIEDTGTLPTQTTARFRALPPEAIDRDMGRLGDVLRGAAARGEQTLILCDNQGQLERLQELLDELRIARHVELGIGSIGGGFVLADAEPPLRPADRPRDLSPLAPRAQAQEVPRRGGAGEHRRAQAGGLRRPHGPRRGAVPADGAGARGRGAVRDAGDRVRGGRAPARARAPGGPDRAVGERPDENAPAPKVHRIGGKDWSRQKQRTKKAIEEMTSELLELYAARAAEKGYAFSADTRWQREMESAFLFEDTPDQRQATEDVKKDMESPRPMDRLICGDVGYGKTEIAIRAAFKSVQDGKQVAVLVPTTILAEQHMHTFSERLADFPVRIEALSRFRTTKEQTEVLKRPAGGRGGHPDRHAPPAVARRALQGPGPHRRRRGAALRGEAQGAPQAAAPHGGRAYADGDAHPAHPALLHAGAARHDADPDAAARPAAGDHPRAPLGGRDHRGRHAARAGPRRAGVLRPQPGGDDRRP